MMYYKQYKNHMIKWLKISELVSDLYSAKVSRQNKGVIHCRPFRDEQANSGNAKKARQSGCM